MSLFPSSFLFYFLLLKFHPCSFFPPFTVTRIFSLFLLRIKLSCSFEINFPASMEKPFPLSQEKVFHIFIVFNLRGRTAGGTPATERDDLQEVYNKGLRFSPPKGYDIILTNIAPSHSRGGKLQKLAKAHNVMVVSRAACLPPPPRKTFSSTFLRLDLYRNHT